MNRFNDCTRWEQCATFVPADDFTLIGNIVAAEFGRFDYFFASWVNRGISLRIMLTGAPHYFPYFYLISG